MAFFGKQFFLIFFRGKILYHTHFYRAIRKHGLDAFEWDIIVEFKHDISDEMLDRIETEYIRICSLVFFFYKMDTRQQRSSYIP